MHLAAGHKLEGGFVAEVQEALAGSPADVYLLDVGGGEGVGSLSPYGLELCLEVAQLAELDALAFEDELAQAADGDGEDGEDVPLAVDAAVAGDVVGEGVDVEHFAGLCYAVGFGFGDVFLLGSGLCGHDGNAVVNHCFWGLGGS